MVSDSVYGKAGPPVTKMGRREKASASRRYMCKRRVSTQPACPRSFFIDRKMSASVTQKRRGTRAPAHSSSVLGACSLLVVCTLFSYTGGSTVVLALSLSFALSYSTVALGRWRTCAAQGLSDQGERG